MIVNLKAAQDRMEADAYFVGWNAGRAYVERGMENAMEWEDILTSAMDMTKIHDNMDRFEIIKLWILRGKLDALKTAFGE